MPLRFCHLIWRSNLPFTNWSAWWRVLAHTHRRCFNLPVVVAGCCYIATLFILLRYVLFRWFLQKLRSCWIFLTAVVTLSCIASVCFTYFVKWANDTATNFLVALIYILTNAFCLWYLASSKNDPYPPLKRHGTIPSFGILGGGSECQFFAWNFAESKSWW